MSNIVLSANKNTDIYVLPIVPRGLKLIESQKNETFEGLEGDLTLIGNRGLREITPIVSFFPVNKKYNFVAPGSESDGWKYVKFIQNLKKSKTPVRVVWTSKQKTTIFNGLCSIESFQWEPTANGDIKYELNLKEFGEP